MKPKPPLSQHTVSRLAAWLRVWLQAFSTCLLFLLQIEPQRTRRAIDDMARFGRNLVFLNVAARCAPPLRKTWRSPVRRAGFHRALIGVRLRRRLRGRDPIARFFAILALMRDLETETRRLQRRIGGGLTRRRPIAPRREHVRAPLQRAFITPHAADTS